MQRWGREASAHLLDPDETLLWSGRPKQGLMLTMRDAYLIPFSMLWCGFAIFWTMSAASMGAPWFFVLFGLGFVAFGLYFVVGRFVHDAMLRQRTHYAVTDRRVALYRDGLNSVFKSLDIDRLPEITVEDIRADGSGTLRFEARPPVRFRRRGSGVAGADTLPSLDSAMAFLRIDNVTAVQRTVREAAEARRNG